MGLVTLVTVEERVDHANFARRRAAFLLMGAGIEDEWNRKSALSLADPIETLNVTGPVVKGYPTPADGNAGD